MSSNRATSSHYDQTYREYRSTPTGCAVSLDDLRKARRRVGQLASVFGLTLSGVDVFDIGSGLGCYAEALRLAGARVTALDSSSEAIELATRSFPEVTFRHGSFPEDLLAGDEFDLIWACDLSTLNTFDVDRMKRIFVDQAMHILRPGGALVVGWHTDFSGRVVSGWSHWRAETMAELRTKCGFSRPFIAEARLPLLSSIFIRSCRTLGRSIPVFLVRRA